jgi:hypothetical protein
MLQILHNANKKAHLEVVASFAEILHQGADGLVQVGGRCGGGFTVVGSGIGDALRLCEQRGREVKWKERLTG